MLNGNGSDSAATGNAIDGSRGGDGGAGVGCCDSNPTNMSIEQRQDIQFSFDI